MSAQLNDLGVGKRFLILLIVEVDGGLHHEAELSDLQGSFQGGWSLDDELEGVLGTVTLADML